MGVAGGEQSNVHATPLQDNDSGGLILPPGGLGHAFAGAVS